jgi:hypothetical protein
MMMGTDDRTDDRAFGADDVAVPARSSENYVFSWSLTPLKGSKVLASAA